ncbi:MAG: DegQ family serine endoprotease [Syntrophaceae bacterium]
MTKAVCYEEHRYHPLQVLGAAWLLLMLLLLGIAGPAHAQEKALENLKETGKAFAAVARGASPAVVFIRVEKTVSTNPAQGMSPFNDEFFKRFFGEPIPGQPQAPQQQKRTLQGQGSGFIISQDGYILTNNHVVGGADRVLVKLLDGREFTAKTIGTDPPTDVAVVKIDAKNLPVLPLGDSDTLEVGEWVLALGNPFGLSHTLTAGIVSAKGRSSIGIADYEDFIQTDAAINPGNSGGPLINLEGRAVGINTAIFSQSGGYMGIGFAIPVNLVKQIYSQLVDHGTVIRGYLGVSVQDLTPDLAKSFGLKDTKGALVTQAMPDTPAAKAGLKQGDVIVRLNGEPVDTIAPFRNRIALTSPGTTVNLTVIRDGKEKSVPVTIEKMPAAEQAEVSKPDSLDKLGLTVVTLTRELANQYGYQGETGVLVTNIEAGSSAARAGIRPGVVIQEVNRKPVGTVQEFKQAVAGKGTVLLLIKDKKGSQYVSLKIEG